MLTSRCPGSRSRPAARLLCGALALVLVASNALAAMGVCVVKAPVSASTAVEEPCPQHVGDAQPAGQTAAHCPQDDPGAQARTADLPAAHLDAVPAFSAALALNRVAGESRRAVSDHVPHEPLYARLSRLLL